jgi:nitroimidazol reductase NimA-like FMN-containing flavoprotein (pyridoxamine 5'-phosphate oxidase superfamily)
VKVAEATGEGLELNTEIGEVLRGEQVFAPRQAVRLDTEESLRLLGSVRVGRVVFSYEAMPAIRPVNHLVDDGKVIIRVHDGAAIIPAALRQAVVAYEADDLDPDRRVGWSVIVTGMARFVTSAERIQAYGRRLRPWVDDAMDHVIEISPGQVTGMQLVE